jgi:hypothetical protein
VFLVVYLFINEFVVKDGLKIDNNLGGTYNFCLRGRTLLGFYVVGVNFGLLTR